MNIGEIKKPSVDGQLVKPKNLATITTPIESLKSIDDQIDISIRAREKYQKYKKKALKQPHLKESESEPNQSNPRIDFIA